MNLKRVSVDFAEQLIDFAPTEQAKRMGFAEAQLEGAVAVYNMLSRHNVGYIADEVGMGKTYVALGVMGLLRYQQPDARIVVLTPRQNIQLKWIKELRNFVRDNWRHEDNRVKNLHSGPIRSPIACDSLDDLSRLLRVDDTCDLFLRSTTFSVAVKKSEGRKRCRSRLLPHVPWVDPSLLSTSDPKQFLDMYGRILNAIIPEIDLLVVDEAHNFKHGFGEHVSNRNRLLGFGFGHPGGAHSDCGWYGSRVKRVLMLSATPFEYDYADIYKQLDVFGFGDAEFVDADGEKPIAAEHLLSGGEDSQRELLKRFLIRRVQHLNIAGKRYSKNMYRREWQQGGYEKHDEPIAINDPRQRLIVGLVQKKVSEILGDRRFNHQFQIGMLSSFESFMETISRNVQLHDAVPPDDDEDRDGAGSRFYGEQEATRTEKQGIDSRALEDVVTSYREQFGHSLPHPKLDATAQALTDAFATGEKALVFVRRVATVAELKAKLDGIYDGELQGHMEAMLPGLRVDIKRIFDRYRRETQGREPLDENMDLTDEVETVNDELAYDSEDNEGGTDSFFAWFFRGEGPKGLLSGAAFQRNRLAAVSSAYATFFEDDHVARLLEHPADVVAKLADVTHGDVEQTRVRLRQLAAAYFHAFRARQRGDAVYPRRYVFEAYQAAGLRLLEDVQGSIGEQANVILHERYNSGYEADVIPPTGFPEPQDGLGLITFFTELVKRDELRQKIWPDNQVLSFREQFRCREQRRELLSAMARLGASYIDLYLLAIRGLGSFDVGDTGSRAKRPRLQQNLVTEYLDLLESQMHAQQPAFNAFRELSDAAEAFDTLIAVNFPEVRDAPMSQFSTLFGRVLQKQEPVGRMSGGVNKRLVKQFRMPGYPLVLATTDVLQEGEDLHTFCQRVIHYGITWTPSAMEQRTGRVDRIGSLVQRRLDGNDDVPEPHELIQVYYPHLSDTVERLQVRRVLERLHTFLCMVHRNASANATHDSRLNVATEILRVPNTLQPLEGLLESDFPVTCPWLQGEQTAQDVDYPQLDALESFFACFRENLVADLGINIIEAKTPRRFAGSVAIYQGRIVRWDERHQYPHHREQPFELSMRSQRVGDATLVRCVSPIGRLDLQDDVLVDELYDLQCRLGMVRVSTRFDTKQRLSDTSIEGDRLFQLETTQYEELEDMLVRTVMAADWIEAALLNCDAAASQWVSRDEEENPDA